MLFKFSITSIGKYYNIIIILVMVVTNGSIVSSIVTTHGLIDTNRQYNTYGIDCCLRLYSCLRYPTKVA